MPWLVFDRGRIGIMDGRHRLYALIDEGYTHVRVMCNPWHAVMVSSLVDDADGGPDPALSPQFFQAARG